MSLLQYIDLEVPGWAEFASVVEGGPPAVISQAAAAAFPDRGAVGMNCAVVAGAAGYGLTEAFGSQTELAVSFWLYIDPGHTMVHPNYVFLLGNNGESTFYLYLQYATGWGGIRCRFQTAGTVTTPAENMPLGRWVHVAVRAVRDAAAGTHTIWLDGRQVAQTAGIANPGANSMLRVGPWSTSAAFDVTMFIDEVKIGTAYADVQPFAASPSAATPCAERTLIVVRANNADSAEWGEYYRAARSIPYANVCRVPCTANELLADYATFQSEVETPISTWLAINTAAAANITTILLGYGVPGGFTVGGVDYSAASRLTRLGSPRAQTANPLYDEDGGAVARVTAAVLAGAGSGLAYLVHRIDAPSLAAAKDVVDAAVALDDATLAGEGYLDPYGPQGGDNETYEDLLEGWGNALLAQRLKQTVNKSAATDPGSNVAFDEITDDDWFFGWASDTGSMDFFGAQGAGARALFFDGDDYACQTLRDLFTERWCWLALANGYALTIGAVAPPGVGSLIAPAPLFECLRQAMTFAEAYIQAVPDLDWEFTPVGDPLAVVNFPAAGVHFYRGPNAIGSIDYGALIGAAPAGATSLRLPPCDWPAGVTWLLAVRTVDSGGVEYADPQAIVRCEFDEAGQRLPDRPEKVRALSARPASGQRLEVAWRFVSGGDRPAPEQFEIFIGPAEGQTLEQLLSGDPAATVPAESAALSRTYLWTSGALETGVAWRVAVRAVTSSEVAGPAASVIGFAQPNRAVPIDTLFGEVR